MAKRESIYISWDGSDLSGKATPPEQVRISRASSTFCVLSGLTNDRPWKPYKNPCKRESKALSCLAFFRCHFFSGLKHLCGELLCKVMSHGRCSERINSFNDWWIFQDMTNSFDLSTSIDVQSPSVLLIVFKSSIFHVEDPNPQDGSRNVRSTSKGRCLKAPRERNIARHLEPHLVKNKFSGISMGGSQIVRNPCVCLCACVRVRIFKAERPPSTLCCGS